MPGELKWLTYTVILTGILWIPYILDRAMVRGLMGSMANPSPDLKPQALWAQRLQAAHYNTVENLVVFAVLVLILNAIHVSTATTVMACAVFFWSRLAYVIVYAAGHRLRGAGGPGTSHPERDVSLTRRGLKLRSGARSDCARVGAAWQRAENRIALAVEPRGAEGVGDRGRRMLQQQRRLQCQHQVARKRARLRFVVMVGRGKLLEQPRRE
jgi:uncharacterized MAPEG superfamily protein